MEGCIYAVELFCELFQLEQKYGYSPGTITQRNYECSVMFSKGDREVLFLVDLGYGLPAIMLRPPDPSERFGLHEAIPAIDPDFHDRQPKDVGYNMTAMQLRSLLIHYASFFHAHSKGLLVDHHAIFSAVKQHRQQNLT